MSRRFGIDAIVLQCINFSTESIRRVFLCTSTPRLFLLALFGDLEDDLTNEALFGDLEDDLSVEPYFSSFFFALEDREDEFLVL